MCLMKLEIGKRMKTPIFIETAQTADARNGGKYQRLIVRDTDGEKIKMNSFLKPERFVEEKAIIDAVIEAGEYEGNKTYTLKDWDPSDKPRSSFIPKAKIDIEATWKQISSLIKTIKDERYCRLACKVITNELAVFTHAPLTASDEYSRNGGLMEATYKLMQLADSTATTMGYDRDLMLSAAAVYYSGSTMMVDNDYQPTREVALKGFDIAAHDKLVVAHHMIPEDKQLDEESFEIFDNILLSRYQGKPVATKEAFALKMLDSIITVGERCDSLTEGLKEGSFMKETDARMWYRRMEDHDE